MKFIKYVTDIELIDAISERQHLINFLLRGKDKLPRGLSINELLFPTGVSIYNYCDAEKQVDNYINEMRRRNNIWYIIWTNIKIFIRNIFYPKCPNCKGFLELNYDPIKGYNIYICNNCKKEYI